MSAPHHTDGQSPNGSASIDTAAHSRGHPSRGLSWAPLAMTVLFIGLLWWRAGVLLAGLIPGVGAIAMVAGCRAITGTRFRAQAGGALLIALGLIGGLVSILLTTDPVLTGLLSGGTVAIVAVGVVALEEPPTWTTLNWALRDTAVTAVPTTALITAIVTGTLMTVLTTAWAGLLTVTGTPYPGFLSLLVLATATILVGSLILAAASSVRPAALDPYAFPQLVDRAFEVRTAVLYLAVIALFVLAAPTTATAFNAVIGGLGPLGSLLEVGFTNPAIHALLLGTVFVGGVVWMGWFFAPVATAWIGPLPRTTVAFALPGIVCPPLGYLVGPIVGVSPLEGVLLVALSLVSAVFAALLLSTLAGAVADWRRLVLGGGCVAFLSTVGIGSVVGVHPVFVFAGVALGICIWDLSRTNQTMAAQLRHVDRSQPLATHATATVLVGVVGVGLATGTMYGLSAVSLPVPQWQATASILFALVAVLSFVGAVTLENPTRVVTERVSGVDSGYVMQAVAVLGTVVLIIVSARLTGNAGPVLTLLALGLGPVAVLVAIGALASRRQSDTA